MEFKSLWKKKTQSHTFLPWCTHVQIEVSYEMNKMYLFGAAKDTKSLHCQEIPEPAGSWDPTQTTFLVFCSFPH